MSAASAAKHWPSSKCGKPSHTSKVIRAITKGTPVPGGRRVYLEALKFGGQWITTLEAIQEYGARVAAATIGGHEASPLSARPSSPPARIRAAERAARELDALDIR